jgi:hypothetical protein
MLQEGLMVSSIIIPVMPAKENMADPARCHAGDWTSCDESINFDGVVKSDSSRELLQEISIFMINS